MFLRVIYLHTYLFIYLYGYIDRYMINRYPEIYECVCVCKLQRAFMHSYLIIQCSHISII